MCLSVIIMCNVLVMSIMSMYQCNVMSMCVMAISVINGQNAL